MARYVYLRTFAAMAGCLLVCLAVSVACFSRLSAAAEADTAAAAGPDTLYGSTLVVNKKQPLAPDFVPPALADAGGVLLAADAAAAYTAMVADAAAQGVAIAPVSGYRSPDEQERLHSSYTASYGREGADSLSARSGYSEHETGLAVDIGNPDGTCALEACFEATAAGSWAAANAHRYGFLIRYPAGAEHITGYAYEPWHLRYVGQGMAQDVSDAGLTLEEFLGLPAAPGY